MRARVRVRVRVRVPVHVHMRVHVYVSACLLMRECVRAGVRGRVSRCVCARA